MRASVLAGILLLLGSGLVPVSSSLERTTPVSAPSPLKATAGAGVGPGSDFNGDGYADLAVAACTMPTTQTFHSGLSASFTGRRMVSPLPEIRYGSSTFPMKATPFRLVGDIAAADFDGDGFTDLAVGLYPSDPELVPLTGAIRILYGSAGLQRGRSQLWTSASSGLPAFHGSDDYSFGKAWSPPTLATRGVTIWRSERLNETVAVK
ncbi:hypothetical protein MLP_08550 [Microlunatus phosphovorus NM-1]|uniref:Esterase n=1 Tax=Microlunatus phosphovorus (strain ATCC 700054 / DSM 10555 / JCM 9379 / NBRC 101784 / NCIMB 13414 / VKM Ac-1990 / NM-1) TaxID=1032480 RepID=F5XLZ0_MICPN|nr:VCBS repeat-containing protein [Microlunatus phosphovorus]BAK33869.1 hypothetical protein MLP_08550 [Microlunatus phosphovorus NM-1]